MRIETGRLILRRWKVEDLKPFFEINSDPRVMEYFPKVLTQDDSNAMIDRIEGHFERHQFGLWAMESKADGAFLGFTGLAIPSFSAPFTPCVEIGWRLAYPYWGKGYVTEAAREAVETAFTRFKLKSLVSFTVPMNLRSRAVMQRLGLTYDPKDDFEHPSLPSGHPLRNHVLYRLMSDELFLEAFEACKLPKSEWTHHAHVRMAWLYLRNHSPSDALSLIRSRIRRYNAATGVSIGYHETVTQAYFRLISERMRRPACPQSWQLFSAAFPELFDRTSPPTLRHYRRETILAAEARASFVEPDLEPLP